MDTRLIGPYLWEFIHAIGPLEAKLKKWNQNFLHDFLVTLSMVFPCKCGENLKKYIHDHQTALKTKKWMEQIYLLHSHVNSRLGRQNINSVVTYEVFNYRLNLTPELIHLPNLQAWIILMLLGMSTGKTSLVHAIDHIYDLLLLYTEASGQNFQKLEHLQELRKGKIKYKDLLKQVAEVIGLKLSPEQMLKKYGLAAVNPLPTNILDHLTPS